MFSYAKIFLNIKGRGGHFQDRNRGDDHNENSMQRSQDSNGNRGGFRGGRGGGFQNRRDGESGDFGRRGDRGGSQRGRMNDIYIYIFMLDFFSSRWIRW